MLRFALLLPLLVFGDNAINQFGKMFLKENKDKEGVIELPSGLQYKVLRKGTGTDHPTIESPCMCHYEGKIAKEWSLGEEYGGQKKFDSSYDRGEPTEFAPNQVIGGWTEAMQMMVEGDKWELYIPPTLGYGEEGSPPDIPPREVLVFTMEIIKINGDKVSAAKCDVKTLENCSDKEKAYMEKQKAKGKDKMADELKRLDGLKGGETITGAENRNWLFKRMSLLEKMRDEL